jgi:hypothetical protein
VSIGVVEREVVEAMYRDSEFDANSGIVRLPKLMLGRSEMRGEEVEDGVVESVVLMRSSRDSMRTNDDVQRNQR